MARILVTGGAVHAKLDAVKIVTNRFKGGRMFGLARELANLGHDVRYLCAKGLRHAGTVDPALKFIVSHHDGFIDYMDHVQALAPRYDMVILGAAVANLIPEPPWPLDEKFPSHDYEEGDVVDVRFRVAPRVINLVKDVAPTTTLIGFKLLSGVDDEELVRASWEVARGSRADLVIANDATNLDRRLLVTKERGVIPTNWDMVQLAEFLVGMAEDEYYGTEFSDYEAAEGVSYREASIDILRAKELYRKLNAIYGPRIEAHGRVGDLVFGCLAVRCGDGFLCSTRGKETTATHAYAEVDHTDRTVRAVDAKVSLNAPLLSRLLANTPEAMAIVHTHKTGTDLPKLPYAPPGTVRDTMRQLPAGDFEIEYHGTFRYIWD